MNSQTNDCSLLWVKPYIVADIFVVIGTSLTVHPATELIRYAHPDVPI